MPAAVILTETTNDKTEVDALKTLQLSNNTVCRRIYDMGVDIVDQLVGKKEAFFCSWTNRLMSMGKPS